MLKELYQKFLTAKSGEEIRGMLRALGDFPKEVVLGQTFGERFAWLPVGGRTTNVATIELATHPGRALVERINNAIDALVVARMGAATFIEPPQTPAEAARFVFSRPTDPKELAGWYDDVDPSAEAGRLSVIILDGKTRDEPRVDVFDSGTGIAATAFRNTILSLNEENKIKVPYALGLFGQGGSSSFAFAAATLIVSRSVDSPGVIGFTVVRRCEIAKWKESCYCYLAVRDGEGKYHIPSVAVDATVPAAIYPPTGDAAIDAKLPGLRHGTLVRHFDYALPNMANALSSSQRNLYHSLHHLLFDPLVPYRLTDLREGSLDTRHVAGSRNRLMKLVLKAKEKSPDSRVELKHYRAKEFIAPPGTNDPCLAVEYWVVFCSRKEKDGSYELRSGTEQFCDRDHPILFTYHGQDHGEVTADPLRKIGLNMLRRHIVVHIDASGADSETKRHLFTSTRESLRKSALLDAVIERLQQMLRVDHRLYELEKELTDRALTNAGKAASGEVKHEVIKLLKENGISVSMTLGLVPARERQGGGARQKLPPLPTLTFPKVTCFEVVAPVDGTKAHLGESKSVVIETDADAEFDTRGLIQCRCEPGLLEITHKAPLHGGRMSWRLFPVEAAKPGNEGKIIVTLCIPTPNGPEEAFRQEIAFEIVAPRPARQTVVLVPDLEILPISAFDSATRQTWSALWPDVDPDNVEATQTVAYKLFRNSRTVVYYSVDFPHYRAVVEKWKSQSPAKCRLFDDAYKTFVAFHAVTQALSPRAAAADLDLLDRIGEEERAITAAMIAKQAEIIAELRHEKTLAQA